MQIYGLNKTTLLDYPGHVAATVFTGGCNFRCPFCQNGGLVLQPQKQAPVSEEELFAFLDKRKGILQGVCVTGGEPTLQQDLPDFLARVKEAGYLVKLDTNGYLPEVLERILAQGLADYVAMDIKASKENYARAVGYAGPKGSFRLDSVEKSVELLKESGIEYEFRTTVVKGIHCPEEFEEIGKWLSGAKAYYLQSFQDSEELLAKKAMQIHKMQKGQSGINDGSVMFGTFSKEDLLGMAAQAGKYIPRVELRGVE